MHSQWIIVQFALLLPRRSLPNLERGAWIATDVLPVVEADRCAGSIEDRAKDKVTT